LHFQKKQVVAKTWGSKQISGNWRKSFPNPKPQAMEKNIYMFFNPDITSLDQKFQHFNR